MDRLGGSFGPYDADDHPDYDLLGEESVVESPPSPVGQDERRMQVRAYNHWASLLGDRNFPHIEDLYPEEMEDFGPYSVLLDFSLGIDNPAVQYLGDSLAEECDADRHTIELLSDVPGRSLLSRITDHYMQILANQAPIGFEAEFVNQRGATVLYRGILLPYSSDNDTIDFIYGVINWKEMADQHTADALLLEIDQALGDVTEDEADATPLETAETLTARPGDMAGDMAQASWDEEDILDLGSVEMIEEGADLALPQPAFGMVHAGGEAANETTMDEDELLATVSSYTAPAARADRSVDALGNPVGGAGWHDHGDDGIDDADVMDGFDGGMKTAADYGLPDWDDEPEAEDVDGVIDPLADEEATSGLSLLVSRGLRNKKAVDLSQIEPQAPIPQAYDGAGVDLPPFHDTPYQPDAVDAAEPQELAVEAVAADVPPTVLDDEDDAGDIFTDPAAAEGLYNCLASARELAQAALSTEDRSRKTLYAAVDRAYDFSFEADSNPEDYAEIIADNGLTVQDRAPMTPIVKLVFGAEYDKTRLTEYAAVLMHARRIGVERGQVGNWLRKADGGLKGIVNAERRARKEEQGKPVEDDVGIRAALARKLRKVEPVDFGALPVDGPEFALVMIRRTETGELVIVGEVPEDVPLIERAARKLLG